MRDIILCVFGVITGSILRLLFFNTEKRYPVEHTRIEWINTIHAFDEIQNTVRMSDLPANKAFWCDSVLQAQKNDINQQVYSAMQAEAADTVKPKKK